ncbi:MAG: hypothetical protein QY314_02090 [Candidatus Dojkabacteria bacterium]|nr:MAG: hypothetical protein QY314_02090 [Candidatus Dojkabacteria bacterium]
MTQTPKDEMDEHSTPAHTAEYPYPKSSSIFPKNVQTVHTAEIRHPIDVFNVTSSIRINALAIKPEAMQEERIEKGTFYETVATGFQNALNYGYSTKKRYVTKDIPMGLGTAHTAYIVTLGDDIKDYSHGEFRLKGRNIIETGPENNPERVVVLGGFLIRKPRPLDQYLGDFVKPIEAEATMLEFQQQILRQYGQEVSLEQLSAVPIVEWSRAVNMSRNGTNFRQLFGLKSTPALVSAMAHIPAVKDILIKDALMRSIRIIEGTEPKIGIIGSVGFQDEEGLGGHITMAKGYLTQIGHQMGASRNTLSVNPIPGLHPNFTDPHSTSFIDRFWATSPENRGVLTPGFLNTYNGPDGVGGNYALEFLGIWCNANEL